MKILHLNVRLQEGGAARIALDLHRQLQAGGCESRLGYGWGERGGTSSAQHSIPHSFQVGNRLQVAGNMLLHRLFGVDFLAPSGDGQQQLKAALHWADVVHLHVIHSYFLPFRQLVTALLDAGKPVVWTAHDYWMLTGRCAFTEGCVSWRDGCGACLRVNNYPPVWLDWSAAQFKRRRQALASLGSLLHVICPSEFVAQAFKAGLPDTRVSVIANWLDSEFEAALQGISLTESALCLNKPVLKVLVMANDLADSSKVDRLVINPLLAIKHVELHTIGLASPFTGANVVNHGRIASRARLVQIIAAADLAVFTSEKDTFGLVMIEALACGVPVFATESQAAREVLAVLGLTPAGSQQALLDLLRDKLLPACYRALSAASLRNTVLKHYAAAPAIQRYRQSYAYALSCQ